MLNRIFETIQKHDCITIFRHELPDMDALGSQMGLSIWIKETFPEKQVYCLGQENHLTQKFNVSMDIVDDELIKNSLAIVLDTSNQARVDDKRYVSAKDSIRMDHHVFVETICDYEWIEPKASATCEMIGLFLKETNQTISSQAAQFLYNGLIADNIRFSVSSVRKETYDAAGYLFSMGVDVVKAEQDNFSSSYSDYTYETYIASHSQKVGKCLYAIMDRSDYESCFQTFASAKEKVYVMSGIEGIEVWALFTQMEDGIHYSASLRSKTIPIRDIAQKFGGGGHECASGIKNLTYTQVQEIITSLTKRSLNQ